MALANILESICEDFHQNRKSPVGCRADTHTHTHTHTYTLIDRQTDIQTPSARFQHIQSETIQKEIALAQCYCLKLLKITLTLTCISFDDEYIFVANIFNVTSKPQASY